MFEGFALHRGYGWGVLIGLEGGVECKDGVEDVIVAACGGDKWLLWAFRCRGVEMDAGGAFWGLWTKYGDSEGCGCGHALIFWVFCAFCALVFF